MGVANPKKGKKGQVNLRGVRTLRAGWLGLASPVTDHETE